MLQKKWPVNSKTKKQKLPKWNTEQTTDKASVSCRTSSGQIYKVTRVPRGEEKNGGTEKISEEIMTKNVRYLMKITHLESPKQSKHRNMKTIARHSIIKLSKTSDKEKKIRKPPKRKDTLCTKTKKNFLMGNHGNQDSGATSFKCWKKKKELSI